MACRVLRFGLIGGAPGSFIGPVHLMAGRLDGEAELVCGSFSSKPEKSIAAGIAYGIEPHRAYVNYEEMFKREREIESDETRMDFVIIATPNDTHIPIALMAIEYGFHIVCDKPISLSVAEAKLLPPAMLGKNIAFAVTHSYTGYPAVRLARQMVTSGELGKVLAVRSKYLQGGALKARDLSSWKSDGARLGRAYAFSDIGVHAFNMIRYITGDASRVDGISAKLIKLDESRPLDDYGVATITFKDGGLGSVIASKITSGCLNDLTVEVDCLAGSLVWHQEDPDKLIVMRHGKPKQIYTAGESYTKTAPSITRFTRLPGGHPEGFIEALANVYRSFYDDIRARMHLTAEPVAEFSYPDLNDGLEGMAFIDACVDSSLANGSWVKLDDLLA